MHGRASYRPVRNEIRASASESPLTSANAAARFSAAVQSLASFPDKFVGRGIVIPGGGTRYFTCAWVNIHMLRRLGCTLPIELWHLGPKEMTPQMRKLVEPLGVRVVDGLAVHRVYPVRILNGWELKPYAIMHSSFEEVLLLDADNVAVVDPTFLFETAPYRALGSIFWPDYERLTPTREIWKLTGVPYRDEPEFETGQIVINKRERWKPLSLTMWMNEYSDFWYEFIHGDKETFHFAWRKLNVAYAMPERGIEPLDGVMCQHDFLGRRIFQHRNMAKWKLNDNRRISGFIYEDECLAALEELAKKMAG
jgi:hypothetical protein